MNQVSQMQSKRESMQQTEIGYIPQTWEVGRVDSVFTIQQGKQVSKKNRIGDNQCAFLRTRNVLWNQFELDDLDKMNFTEAEETRLALAPGDLLLCEGGDIGRTAMWNEQVKRCYHQNHLHRLRAIKAKVDPQYAVFWFWYAFQIGQIYFGRGNVTTIPNISQAKLAELPMLLPPLPEQKKIAHILSSVQQAIHAQQRLIETTTELKRALMHKLFTEGLNSGWALVSISEVADFSRGVSWKKSEEVRKGEGTLVVSIPNIKHGWIDYESKFTHYLGKAIPQGKLLNVGDIVFVGSSGSVHNVGRNVQITSLPFDKVAFASFTFKATPKKGAINADFLYFLVNSDRVPFPHFCKRAADGKFNFQLRDFAARLQVPLPPLTEQKKIVHTLSTVQHKIEIAESKKGYLKSLFHTLLHELMSAKIRAHGL